MSWPRASQECSRGRNDFSLDWSDFARFGFICLAIFRGSSNPNKNAGFNQLRANIKKNQKKIENQLLISTQQRLPLGGTNALLLPSRGRVCRSAESTRVEDARMHQRRNAGFFLREGERRCSSRTPPSVRRRLEAKGARFAIEHVFIF